MLPFIAAAPRLHQVGRSGSSQSLASSQDAAPAPEVTRGSVASSGEPGAPALASRRLRPLAARFGADAFELNPPVTPPPRRPSSAPPAPGAPARVPAAPPRRACSTRKVPRHALGSPRSGSEDGGESEPSTPGSPRSPALAGPPASLAWGMEIACALLSASVAVRDAQSLRQQLAALRLSLETLLPQGSPAQRRARWDQLCTGADPAWADPGVHPGPGGRLKASFAGQAQALQLEMLAGLVFTERAPLFTEIRHTLARTLRLLEAGAPRSPELELQGMRLRALYLQLPADGRRAELRQLEQLPFQESPSAQRLRALSILTLRIADRGGVATRRALVDTATLDQLRGKPGLRFAVHRAMIEVACLSGLPVEEKVRLQRLCLDMPWPTPAPQTLSSTQTARVSASLRLLVLQALARDGVALKPVLPLREAIFALAARTPRDVRGEVLQVLEGPQAGQDARARGHELAAAVAPPGASGGLQLPAVQPQQPVAARGQLLVVRHHHEGGAGLAGQLHHPREDLVGGAAVQVAGRLVGQHAGGPGDQGAGDGHALALAARKLGGTVPLAAGQAHGRQGLAGAGPGLGHRQAADAKRHGHVVQRAELGQQVVKLVDKAQVRIAQAALFGRAQTGQGRAHERHFAAGGRIEPAQEVQQGALARARGADDGHRLAGMHLQVDAAQHFDIEPAFGEALGQALGPEHDPAHSSLTHSAAPPPG